MDCRFLVSAPAFTERYQRREDAAEEVSIDPLDVETFRVPGASKGAGTGKVTVVAGVDPNRSSVTGMNGDDEDSDEERLDFCVASVKKGDLKDE